MPGLEDNINLNKTTNRENNSLLERNLENPNSEIGIIQQDNDEHQEPVRETTQTDHLNQKLLKSVLERMQQGSFTPDFGTTSTENENRSFDDESS